MCMALLGYSQYNLSFCTFVNSANQECVFNNTKFITSPDSAHARIYMMLRGGQIFGTEHLTFKIYGVDRFDKEVYLNTITQDVHADWMNAWQPAQFNTPGKYMVKVFKDDSTMITSRSFEFFNY
jgi:hypothetical protein